MEIVGIAVTPASISISDKENKLCSNWRLFPRTSPAISRREGTMRVCRAGGRALWPRGGPAGGGGTVVARGQEDAKGANVVDVGAGRVTHRDLPPLERAQESPL
jgi:hypothetical protein